MQIPVTSACHLRFLIKSGFDHFVSIHNVSVDGTAVHWTSVSTFRQVVNRSKYMYMNEANNYSYLLAEGCWLLVTVLYGCNVKPCGFCHCPLGKLGLTVSIKCRSPLQLPPPPPPHLTNIKVSSVFYYYHWELLVCYILITFTFSPCVETWLLAIRQYYCDLHPNDSLQQFRYLFRG